jgi:hypothetical protein
MLHQQKRLTLRNKSKKAAISNPRHDMNRPSLTNDQRRFKSLLNAPAAFKNMTEFSTADEQLIVPKEENMHVEHQVS